MFLIVKKSIETCRTSLATRLFTSRCGKNKRSSGDSWQDINIRLRQKQVRRSRFRRLAQTLPSSLVFFCELAAPLCCFLQIISKRRPRVKRFILKSHSLTAEKSAATLLCNTPCISSAAWITCTAAANQISSECRLTLPRSLTDILREKPTVFFSAAAASAVPTSPAPLFTIHCHLPRSRLLMRLPGGISHTSMRACPLVALNRLETKDINVNNPWRDE